VGGALDAPTRAPLRLRAGQSRDPARGWADEFLRFLQANPKPVSGASACPDAGSAAIPVLGADLDIAGPAALPGLARANSPTSRAISDPCGATIL